MLHNNTEKNKSWFEKKKSWWQLLLTDILLAAAVAGIFAFFHVLLPRITRDEQGMGDALYDVREESEITENTSTEYNTGERKEENYAWRGKFFSYFSKDIEKKEKSYSSPGLSVQISEHKTKLNNSDLAYYVADIHIADIENFKNGFSIERSSGSPEAVAAEHNAILAMNGDYCMNQKEGFLVRDGKLYLTEQTKSDICVLYCDGTVETYGPDEYKTEELMKKEPWQVWKFGPELLDKNGRAKTEFNTSDAILNRHPRSALGYYEPGHYCFVVVDGRQPGYSNGISMADFSKLFEKLGCERAFNMDGGASSCMVFMGEIVNSPCGGGREISDMLIIKEREAE